MIIKSRNSALALLAASAAASALSGTLVHIYSSKKLSRKFDDLLTQETHAVKEFYARQFKDKEYSDPVTLAAKIDEEADAAFSAEDEINAEAEEAAAAAVIAEAADIIEKQGYVDYNKVSTKPAQTPEEVVEVTASQRMNIWDQNQGDVDLPDDYIQNVEHAKRDQNLPHILTLDEYLNNDENYAQEELTFFEGDGVLVDKNETPIEDPRKIIGEGNLRFGIGSDDPDQVYVANPGWNASYEITRSRGAYQVQVLGADPTKIKPRP